jgi:hypothetical protein
MNPNKQDGGIESRLPTDPAYWNNLASRIVTGAEPVLEEYRTWEPWWKPLANFGPSLGVAAAAAALVFWLVAPDRGVNQTFGSHVQHALAPPDPVAQDFVLSMAPPDIGALFAMREEGSP